MRTRTSRTSKVTIRVVGLLVLAGVFSVARPAQAQMQEACPIPAGVTPPADPIVTAQQVENNTATLEEFTLAVRERSKEHQQAPTVEGGLYIGCIIRQEGSAWHSGSTYIVTLTLDGRVYVHAKDMSLSGRMLNPVMIWELYTLLFSPSTPLLTL